MKENLSVRRLFSGYTVRSIRKHSVDVFQTFLAGVEGPIEVVWVK